MASLSMNDSKLKREHSRQSSDSSELQHKPEELGSLTVPEHDALVRSAHRKLDFTLTPIMTLFQLFAYLGQTNIGNARVAGLQASLKLTDDQFQVALTIFFIPFMLSQLPANLLQKKIGPNILLPSLVMLCGIVVTLQGLVKNYSGLIAARFFVGLLEGPMMPSLTLYLSSFYTRRDLSLRIAYFFCIAALAGAFSGLLAAAIQQMDGIGGKSGWEWIFILEGISGIIIGFASFWLVPANPAQSSVLSAAEKQALIEHLQRDSPTGATEEVFHPREILRALQSPQLYPQIFINFFGGAMFFGVAVFLPSIIFQMEFTSTQSQLMSAGPFATACCVALVVCWISDMFNARGVPITLLASMCGVGWIMFFVSKNVWVSYGAFFLIVPGVFAPSPLVSAWLANNSAGYYRRASTIGVGFTSQNLGAILSIWRFPTSEGPRFVNTTIMNITFSFLLAVCPLINIAVLSWMQSNKQKNRAALLAPFISDAKNDAQVAVGATADSGTADKSNLADGGPRAWAELGDRHPDFKYVM